MSITLPGGALGGAFELDVLDLVSSAPAPEALFRGGVSVTSGRTALVLALQEVPAGPWLLPAYLCSSVLQPLRDARVRFFFYAVGDDLEPRLDALERALAESRPAAVLVIDYFGFPPSQAHALASLTSDWTVVEDCSQGSLVETPKAAGGRLGRISFTSFRKYLPVPDGGVAYGLGPRNLPPADGPAVQKRLLGQLLRQFASEEETERVFLRLLEEGEAELDRTIPLHATSLVSQGLLSRVKTEAAATARRRNYRTLLAALDERGALSALSPLRTQVPDGVSPLVLPVRVTGGRRDALRRALAVRRVFCPVHWPLPPEVDANVFREEHHLASEMLGLPIDQRYGAEDMERLAATIADALGELAIASS